MAIVCGAVGVELLLMAYLGERTYYDALRAVRFGRDIVAGTLSIHTDVDNTKTFIGPVLWFQIYAGVGVWGLKAFNLISFAAMALSHRAMGRGLFGARVTLVALFFLCFYPGTHRNVVAGELDDNLAALLLTLAMLVLVRSGRHISAALILGVAFLFKFWSAIFVVGLLLHLMLERRWRLAMATALAAAAPFVALDLLSGGAGTAAFVASIQKQGSISSWSLIGTRLLTTGLAPCFLLAGWAVLRQPDANRRLLFLVPAPYLLYVVVMQDAHAVTFVMMACLVTWSYLIAELVLDLLPRGLQAATLAAYLLLGVAIAVQHLHRDTVLFDLGTESSIESSLGSSRVFGRPSTAAAGVDPSRRPALGSGACWEIV
ncbi:MAG: hypothetical protein VYE73_07255 [Acidobacteriota bacterium]|nr:hypothetical protein [Acidobacteriota bacterium]